ncbi:MAG: secondary thiamine-phosphate synthase enzyme [Planctomycetota bacterium]
MSATLHHQTELQIQTRGRSLVEITSEVASAVAASGVQTGLVTVFCRHTSASLVIQENADPSAARDLLAWFERIAPDGDPAYTHTAEGPDDMPSHLRSAITKTSETLPITGGRLNVGTWQGLYLCEHRTAPHGRELLVHCHGQGPAR